VFRTRLWAWSALGLAGSILVALAAPRALADGVVGWWYHPGFPGSRSAGVTLVWVGMGALALAWLGLALQRAPLLTRRRALVIGGLWLVPLVLAPPLFSRDVYSYLAQGTILHLGLNPYHRAPVVLASLGHGHTLAAVSPFWRRTTAPYGPLFLELISLIVGICGQHLIAGVLLCRLLDLIGLGLVVWSLPRLCRALRADEGRAVWLAAASPLVALALISACHNDLLMAGLLAAGVAVALRGHPLLGVALCALAATIKIPAIVGAVFIVVCWARAETSAGARARLVAAASALAVAIVAIVTAASGVGIGWISTSVFATPAKVHLAITPATAVGYTIATLANDLGASIASKPLENTLGVVATALTACIGLALLWRARVASLAPLLGATLLLAAAGGPAAWPWYCDWGLVVLAAWPSAQRSMLLAAGLVAGAFLVKPDGILVLPLQSAPWVLLAYVLLAMGVWLRRRHRPARSGRAGSDSEVVARGVSSALMRGRV
jgi:alpha-1,6-mannosyltransferase